MAFELPNPSAAFNAMFQAMRLPDFLEIARSTAARRYAQEPHFVRNALQRKAEELEAMELANEMTRRQLSPGWKPRDRQGGMEYPRVSAGGGDYARAQELASQQMTPPQFRSLTPGASPWEAQYRRIRSG